MTCRISLPCDFKKFSLVTSNTIIANTLQSKRNITLFVCYSQDDYEGHFSPIVNCRFSGDGHQIGSIDTDGMIK